LVSLPSALPSAGGLCLALWHGSTRGLDRIRSRTEVVRCNMCHGAGLACGVRSMPWGATEFSGRTHRVTTGGTRFHHLDLAANPGAGMLDRLTRSRIIWLNCLE